MKTTIRETLLSTISPVADWGVIMTNVSAQHTIRKGGWMRVRGELQALINEGLVKRDADVRSETYRRL
jgi:hypothetical protein